MLIFYNCILYYCSRWWKLHWFVYKGPKGYQEGALHQSLYVLRLSTLSNTGDGIGLGVLSYRTQVNPYVPVWFSNCSKLKPPCSTPWVAMLNFMVCPSFGCWPAATGTCTSQASQSMNSLSGTVWVVGKLSYFQILEFECLCRNHNTPASLAGRWLSALLATKQGDDSPSWDCQWWIACGG